MALSSPAGIPNLDKSNKEVMAIEFVQSQMAELKTMMDLIIQESRRNSLRRDSIASIEYGRILKKLEDLKQTRLDLPQVDREYSRLLRDTQEIMMNCVNESEHRMFRYLLGRIERQREDFRSTR